MYNLKAICTKCKKTAKGYIKNNKLYTSTDYNAVCDFCGGAMQTESNKKGKK